ncbi:MAG: hypothetical protein ABS81_09510 [Pseudonocardia sp. SCN 72-86]|nr:MAG: hypothetical protein ABS81_09510 [Pseudonocardia sp. SCN 72-86]
MATTSSDDVPVVAPGPDHRPRPVPDPVTEQYWAWVQREQLRLQWCAGCERRMFPPAPVCPGCRSEALEWRRVTGLGTIHTAGVVRKAFVPGFDPPYAVVSVQLAEQADLHMISNFPMDGDAAPRIGTPVRVAFERRPWGLLPQFVPRSADDGGPDAD